MRSRCDLLNSSAAVSGKAEPLGRPGYWLMFVEFPVAMGIFIVASLNLAYRPILLIIVFSALLLLTFRAYLKWRYQISIPFFVLLLAFAAVGVDTIGNHFRLYQQLPWPVPYDVFAHFTVPALMAPAITWLMWAWLEKIGYSLPLSVLTFFAINVNFSLASFYEITELWDDLYFGGMRIKEIYDTARDLQFDLLGGIFGVGVTYLVMKRAELKLARRGEN